MAEISQRQILDLLYDIHDGLDRTNARLDENIVLLRKIYYEVELVRQQIAQASAHFSHPVQ